MKKLLYMQDILAIVRQSKALMGNEEFARNMLKRMAMKLSLNISTGL